MESLIKFYKGKKVFVTGHTGFKGTWLLKILVDAGASVMGYALKAPTVPSLFELTGLQQKIQHIEGDIRDYEKLYNCINGFQPEIVFHLAAQPIVRVSYEEPRYTYETNVMGTVNICECVRNVGSVKSFLNVTTDKVYKNNEWEWGYRENDYLDGYDPYSNSKSCSELVTHSYVNSFFNIEGIAVSTARAGNVIGGGDFARDRILPDCVRAAGEDARIFVRNPYSTRPYQHVLEALNAYLLIAKKQYEDIKFAGSYNVGPEDRDCITTGELVDIFCEKWGNVSWETNSSDGPYEATYLKLDCSKIKNVFGWKPKWDVRTAVEKTVEWSKNYYDGADVVACMSQQILEFYNGV